MISKAKISLRRGRCYLQNMEPFSKIPVSIYLMRSAPNSGIAVLMVYQIFNFRRRDVTLRALYR